MTEESPIPKPPLSFWRCVARGVVEAHRRRPVSFYLLLCFPVVMVLGAQMARYRDNPERFFLVLAVMLLFFLVASVKAVREFFAITRGHLAESRRAFRETIGDEAFMTTLVERTRAARTRAQDGLPDTETTDAPTES